MSFLFNAGSFPKVRQEGFQTAQNQGQQQQQIPTPNAFDPTSIYTTATLYADGLRSPATIGEQYSRNQQQHPQGASLDIHDELSFLNPPTSATSDSFQRPHDIFGVNQPHYPSLSLPQSHTRPPYPRDDYASPTAASLHNSYGRADFFPNNTGNGTTERPELTPQQQQQQAQFGLLNQTTGARNQAHNPHLDQFNPGAEQSPASGVTRSRSRSRSKVSTSRTRVSKRPSLATPTDSSSPPTRPSAIVIPGGQSQSFQSYHSPATWSYLHGQTPADQYSHEHHPQPLWTAAGPGSFPPGASPSTHNGGSPPGSVNDAAAKLALANEKRRKRRESHNAVERRRRDNINEKIQELALLLPDEWLDGNGKTQGPNFAGLLSGTGPGLTPGGASAMAIDEDGKEIKANKGVILRNSVEYIKNLVQLVQVQRSRNQQLESELAQYRNRFGNVMQTGGVQMNGNAISPSGQSSGTVDDTHGMSNYVISDLGSPDSFDMKNVFGTTSRTGSSAFGPLDSLSGTNMGMEGIEPTSTIGTAVNGGGLAFPSRGLPASLMDTTSPSTGSGEDAEEDHDDIPRGRGMDRGSRFPSGVGKTEDEIATL